MTITALAELLGVGQAGDDFTSELFRIHETIEAEGGPRQPVCLAINRSDYMLHVPEDGVTAPHLLQVSLVAETGVIPCHITSHRTAVQVDIDGHSFSYCTYV